MNFKKIIFFALAITIIFSGIEIITKFSLKYLGYSTVYKTGNIPDNRYNYLTGYYNEPNKKPTYRKNYYVPGTDRYSFQIDGSRKDKDLVEKNKCTFRIFLVGGSTVMGRYLIDKHDPISSRLEKILNQKKSSNKLLFEVINTGSSGFMSSQEVSLIQYKIIYALKPDYIILFNGNNDFTTPLGNNYFNSNSHSFQRVFERNLKKSSKNIFYFFDDFLKKNLTVYFALKKIAANPERLIPFLKKKDGRYVAYYGKYDTVENHVKRYFYNINILSQIASKKTSISVFFQPTMLPEMKERITKDEREIYNNFLKSKRNFFGKDSDYFPSKQIYWDQVRKEINVLQKSLNNDFFQIFDISSILNNNRKISYFSDWAHYQPASRKIISDKIYDNIDLIVDGILEKNFKTCR